MVTLTDISRKTGLSVATVSHALNDRPGYSQKTRDRVRKAARAMGYSANPLARGLLGKRTGTIGVAWSLAGPHSSEGMVRNLVMRAQRRGYSAHLSDSMSDPAMIERQLNDFRQRGVDAVAVQLLDNKSFTPEVERGLGEFDAAVVVSSQEAIGNFDWIHHDRLAALEEMADHFAAHGRRRPGILIPMPTGQWKVDAFLNRCRRRGMSVDERSVIRVRHEQGTAAGQSGLMEACLEAFERHGDFDFDCLACSTDEGAVVAMNWLNRLKLRVPEDVAVAGFNNALFSAWMRPALASVDRCDDEVAGAIEQMVFLRLADKKQAVRRRRIAMRFVVRESAIHT